VRSVNFKGVGVLELCLEIDRTQDSVCDQTHRACVRSQVTYANVGCETWRAEVKKGSDAGLRPVEVHLTRPITVWALWNLFGSDLMCGGWSGATCSVCAWWLRRVRG
jgi:hypothetical protein